ncbi:MAG: MFS transporter [Hyphomicrobiales bacterium]
MADELGISGRGKALPVTVLGSLQILSYGTTFYLLAILAAPITRDTGWAYPYVIAGISVALFVAGLVSPRVGRAINARGGSPVMALCAALIALGLLVIGTAQNLAWYLAGWAVVGVGMGGGLYDAAFATLGRLYGKEARGAITGVTLLGGFASTVCWPISAFLVENFGWRIACFTYAAVWLGIAAPLYLFAVPQAQPLEPIPAAHPSNAQQAPTSRETLIFLVLAAALTISAAILSGMGAHLVTLLQGRGLDLSAAVGLGMLIGPSAVGARLVEMFAGKRYHPIWTMVASAGLVAIGMCLFFTEPWLFGLAVVLYAAGNGIGSIAKGTLPLALFGPARYPVLMGRLGLPIMIAMALMPYLGAIAYEHGGPNWTFGIILALALTNVLLVAWLWVLSRSRR